MSKWRMLLPASFMVEAGECCYKKQIFELNKFLFQERLNKSICFFFFDYV